MKKPSLLMIMMLVFAPFPAQAQQLMNFITRTTIPVVIQCPGCKGQKLNRTRAASPQTPLAKLSNGAPRAEASGILDFPYSRALSRQNLQRFADKMRISDPAGADQFEQLINTKDVMADVGKVIAPYGLRTNNVADAYALYWISAWLGSQGRTDNPTRAQTTATRNQAANALLASPELRAASASQKQEMAEALLIQAALIDASVESAQSNPAFLAQVKAAIVQGAEGMGLDLASMTLTDDGFIPAR
jgi:hypothetical protein